TSANGRRFRALGDDGAIAVEVGGALGDGTSDDRVAIAATFAYAEATGARRVSFGSSAYALGPIESPNFGIGPQPNFILPEKGGTIDGRGARFIIARGGRGFSHHEVYYNRTVSVTVAADLPAGATAIPLAPGDGARLAVGDEVLWTLSEAPYDTPETFNWDFARVVAISGDTVTLDKPVPEPFVLGAVTGVNRRLRRLPILSGLAMRDMVIDAPIGCEDGIEVYAGRNLSFERIGGRNLGAGLFVGQYIDGATLVDCWQDGVTLSQGSYGAMIGLAESRDVTIIRPRAKGLAALVKCEAGATATVIGGHFENTLPPDQIVTVFNAAGRGRISVHDLTVTGRGGYRLAETSNGVPGYEGKVQFNGITRLVHPDDPFFVPLDAIRGTLDMTIGAHREVYDMDRLRHWKRRFPLRDGMYNYIVPGITGMLVGLRAYASPGLTVGPGQRLAACYIGKTTSNGADFAGSGHIRPGEDCAIPVYGGLVGGGVWHARRDPLQIIIVTASGTQLDSANEFLEIEAWLAQPAGASYSVSEASRRAEGDGHEQLEALFRAIDLPSIAAGECHRLELPIEDMTAADLIAGVSLSTGLDGLVVTAVEPRAGSVSIDLHNPTETAIDRGPADLRVAFAHPGLGL
ncbi:MAG: hypothetical protein ABW194_05465, partial [Novosphingobium sp.]